MTATMYIGDAIEVMSKLSEKSVDLILTSPPFLALRSYLPADHPDKALEGGSQATPGEFIDWLVDVVEACDRVLAPHGSLCFELGDTYASDQGRGTNWTMGGDRFTDEGLRAEGRDGGEEGRPTIPGRRMNTVSKYGRGWPLAKSLSLIPELFRLTLVYGTNPLTGRTTERWRLRNVVRWVRPNPPVGALGDKWRPATSELMVFCKSAKRYFDLDATREPASSNTHARSSVDRFDLPSQKRDGNWSTLAQNDYANPAGAPPLDWWNIPPGGFSGAHYAVWPPELLIKPIKAMSPEKVCRVCGEPSRRILADRSIFDRVSMLARHIKERRLAAGLSFAEVNGWFGYDQVASHWEMTQEGQHRIPSADVWPVLKERLALSDEFDDLVLGNRRWTESEIEYRDVSDYPSGWTQDGDGRVYQRLATRKDRIPPDRFSDCGHDDWRPGVVLDPFGGSGTTALVATGHGRDCILIDLDERNYELALQRVGPFILERAS